jgi:sulfane dehydrogenase subunit SoxC
VRLNRRALLAGGAGTVAALGLTRAGAQVEAAPGTIAAPAAVRPPGQPAAAHSNRAPSAWLERAVDAIGEDATTPLQALQGIITPSDLHFSRHHFGTPQIDPAGYRLMVHGLVRKPLVFTLEDLMRFPGKSRVCFLECAGNGAGAYRRPSRELSPQRIDGATSTSEWVGVPLATVLDEAGVLPQAHWFLAESQDAGLYARSIPLSKAYDDAMLAYAQNGEPLRAEQGYPVRLLLPGWEGSASVKWIRRIELLAKPAMTRDETARYSDVLPDHEIHPFVFVMEVKSIITTPAHPETLEPGWREIRGLAWSGRGRIDRVEVSTDGGSTWTAASLDGPVHPKAHTRFRLPWRWDGGETVLMSRAVDETGAVQPTLEAFRESRLPANDYRNNYIRAWRVQANGRIFFASGC